MLQRRIRCSERLRKGRTMLKPRLILAVVAVGLLLCLVSGQAVADYREVAGYVYGPNGESRFAFNVYHFKKHFTPSQNFWELIYGRNWATAQYYWAEERFFKNQPPDHHKSFVDRVDLAYYSGHGNQYGFRDGPGGNWVDLRAAPGYGDLFNGDDLEFLILQTCAAIPSPIERPTDWWTGWVPNGIFQGLHMVVGYRTGSYSGNGISNNFGKRLKYGQGIIWAWFDAVNSERSGGFYPGYASAVLYPGLDNDSIYFYGQDPPAHHGSLRVWYQH